MLAHNLEAVLTRLLTGFCKKLQLFVCFNASIVQKGLSYQETVRILLFSVPQHTHTCVTMDRIMLLNVLKDCLTDQVELLF